MTALGFHYGEEMNSGDLAQSVNAEPTFVRKSLSKLAKAGLVITTRGKRGFCALSRPPEQITLRDIYVASEAPEVFAVHSYPVEKQCPISAHFQGCMSALQLSTQHALECALAQTTLADIVSDVRQRAKKKSPATR